jgi:hypothetical protein
MKTLLKISAVSLLVMTCNSAHAYDQIIRPYQSVRSSGMGGTFETTGLYDQNFFGNPARATANPVWRVTLLDPMVETDTSAISHVSAVTGSGNTVQKIAETAGSDNHLRIQTTMPAYYLPVNDDVDRKWAFAVALITSEQIDFGLSNNFEVDTQAFIDIGPAVTYAHTFLDDDSLSIGVTGHFIYRLSSRSPYTIADLLRGTSFSPSQVGGEGTNLDFDLGVMKKLPWTPLNCDISVGGAVDSVLGGTFGGTLVHPVNAPNSPTPMYRSFGGGVSIHRDTLFFLRDAVAALETSDIGTRNEYGSFYRTLHMGMEARFASIFLGRVGINQGYFAAGVGIDLSVLTIEAATYGEELGLNTGDMQDRRYALRVALQL